MLVGERSRDGREDRHHQGLQEQDDARRRSVEAAHELQVEREQKADCIRRAVVQKRGEVAHGKDRVRKKREMKERRARPPLLPKEEREKDESREKNEAHPGEGGERGKPVERQRARCRVEDGAGQIEAAFSLAVPIFFDGAHEQAAHEDDDGGEDEEKPPVQVLRDETADHRPQGQSDVGGGGGVADSAPALLCGMCRHEERHAARKDEPQGQSLQGAHGDEEGGRGGKRRDEGDGGHRRRADRIDATSAEDVRHAAKRQEQGDGAQEEGGREPREIRRGARELHGDRRDGDVDAAAEKRPHEGREQDCRKDPLLCCHGRRLLLR